MPLIWFPAAGDAIALDQQWTAYIAATYSTMQLFPHLQSSDLHGDEHPVTFAPGDSLVLLKITESSSRCQDPSVTLIVKSCGDRSRIGATFTLRMSALRSMSGALESTRNPTAGTACYKALAMGHKPKPTSRASSLRRAQRALVDACAGSHTAAAVKIAKWIISEFASKGIRRRWTTDPHTQQEILASLRCDPGVRYVQSPWIMTSEAKRSDGYVREFRVTLDKWDDSLVGVRAPGGLRVTSARDGSVISVEEL